MLMDMVPWVGADKQASDDAATLKPGWPQSQAWLDAGIRSVHVDAGSSRTPSGSEGSGSNRSAGWLG